MMKKIVMKIMLASCFLLALVYISCEKKNDIPNQKVQVEEMTTLVNTKGIPHFTTAKDLYATIDKASSLNLEERTKWESEMGFVSQFSLINVALQEIGEAETEEEIDSILEKNKDLIKLSQDEIRPIIPSPAYSFIANREGYFYVNNYLHKVTQEGVLVSKIPGRTAIHEINDEIIMFKTSSSDAKNCGTFHYTVYTEGDRRVQMTLLTEQRESFDGYTYYYRDYVSCLAQGFKKQLLGNWKPYNTIYWHQNLRCEVLTMWDLYGKKGTEATQINQMPTYESMPYSWPDAQSAYEAAAYAWSYPVGDSFAFTYKPSLQWPSFVRVAGQVKSRGTSGWASISCGY